MERECQELHRESIRKSGPGCQKDEAEALLPGFFHSKALSPSLKSQNASWKSTSVALMTPAMNQSSNNEQDDYNCKLLEKILELNVKCRSLEDKLEEKDELISKLRKHNEHLEEELRRKETIRISQLETLAVRNVQLEKELDRCSSSPET